MCSNNVKASSQTKSDAAYKRIGEWNCREIQVGVTNEEATYLAL